MPIKHIATRITAVGLLTAAGILAIGADQLSALAGALEDAVRTDTSDEGHIPEPEPEPESEEAEAEAAARAEDDGYPGEAAEGDDAASGE